MKQLIAEFIASDLFKHFLHAALVVIAEDMCGIYFERRRYFVLRSVFVVAAYLVLATYLGLLLENVLPSCSYLIAFVISFPCFMFCFRCDLWNCLYCFAAAISVQNLSYSVSIVFIVVPGWVANSVVDILVRAILYIAVYALCFFAGVRKFKNLGEDFGKKHFVVIIVILILIAAVYLLQYDKQTLEMLDVDEFLEWRILFICTDFLILLMLFGVCDYNILWREKDILDALRESEKKQYEIDSHTIEMLNLKSHDLKHQLVALRKRADGELEQPIKELENAIAAYNIIAKTGCKPLDVVLTQKHFICNNDGILLTYMVEGGAFSFMRAADIYSLFGNALDNAIQAEMNVADVARRFIRINASARGGLLHIQIENYCEEHIIFKNGLPVTTNQDRVNHGFGMLSIKRTVKQYDGVMTVSCEGNIFCLSIMFPIPDKN